MKHKRIPVLSGPKQHVIGYACAPDCPCILAAIRAEAQPAPRIIRTEPRPEIGMDLPKSEHPPVIAQGEAREKWKNGDKALLEVTVTDAHWQDKGVVEVELQLKYTTTTQGVSIRGLHRAGQQSSDRGGAEWEPRRPNIAELEQILKDHPRANDVWIKPDGTVLVAAQPQGTPLAVTAERDWWHKEWHQATGIPCDGGSEYCPLSRREAERANSR